MAKFKKKGRGKLDLNLTSMLDIVFQLIVFFLLITNFASAELPKLKPPEIEDSQAVDILNRKKITVNVIPYRNSKGESDESGRAEIVRVGGSDISSTDIGQLTLLLKAEKEKDPDIEIDLRADQSIHYLNVQPVMDAITNAGIGRINLVALSDPDKAKP